MSFTNLTISLDNGSTSSNKRSSSDEYFGGSDPITISYDNGSSISNKRSSSDEYSSGSDSLTFDEGNAKENLPRNWIKQED